MNHVLVLALCGAAGLWAQDQERVLTFANIHTPQGYQEVTNSIRSIAEITDIRLEQEAGALTVRGPANRLAVAGWLFQELDRAPDQAPPPNTPMHEFRPEGMGDAVARVYFLPVTATPVAMQELVNAMRSISDIRRLFPVNVVHAVAMRGTSAQVAMTLWGMGEIEHAVPGTAREYRGEAGDGTVKIFFLAHPPTPQGLQELVNSVRSVADLQRFFPIHQAGAIVMLGTPAQAELANWLLARLDSEGAVAPGEMVALGGVVRVVPVNKDAQEIQALVARVRTESQLQRVYRVSTRNAILLRGTASQVGVATRILGGD
jgi:hypothetical protein